MVRMMRMWAMETTALPAHIVRPLSCMPGTARDNGRGTICSGNFHFAIAFLGKKLEIFAHMLDTWEPLP